MHVKLKFCKKLNLLTSIVLFVFFLSVIVVDMLNITKENELFLKDENNDNHNKKIIVGVPLFIVFVLEGILFCSLFLIKMASGTIITISGVGIILAAFFSYYIKKEFFDKIKSFKNNLNTELYNWYYATIYHYSKVILFIFLIESALNNIFALSNQGLMIITILMVVFYIIIGSETIIYLNYKIAFAAVLISSFVAIIFNDLNIFKFAAFLENALGLNFELKNIIFYNFFYIALILLAYGAWLMGVDKELRLERRGSFFLAKKKYPVYLVLIFLSLYSFFFLDGGIFNDSILSTLNSYGFFWSVKEAIYVTGIIALIMVIISVILKNMLSVFTNKIFLKNINESKFQKEGFLEKMLALWNGFIFCVIAAFSKYLTQDLIVFLFLLNINVALFIGLTLLISYVIAIKLNYELDGMLLNLAIILGFIKTTIETILGFHLFSSNYFYFSFSILSLSLISILTQIFFIAYKKKAESINH